MTKKDCFVLGYFSRKVGNTGGLALQMDVDSPARYKKLQSIFVELNNSLIPFFIKAIRINGSSATLTLDGIDSITKAQELVKASVYLPLSFLPTLNGKKFYFHEIVGYTVTDKNFGDIGIIQSVLDFPQQAIFQIQFGKHEILIPAKEEFIEKIDRDIKQLLLNAPEGLIDIYINPTSVSDNEKETE